MKIIKIELFRLVHRFEPPFPAAWDPNPRLEFHATVVATHTDSGIIGIGSGDRMVGFEEYFPFFIGKDPLAIAQHATKLETLDFHSSRYWPFEVSLWDIAGKATGLPAATLLGGAKSSIAVYASFGSVLHPNERLRAIEKVIDEGFRAIKLRIDPKKLRLGLETLEAIRERFSDEIEIIIDLNQGWRMEGDVRPPLDLPGATNAIKHFMPFNPLWIEEPLLSSSHSELLRLREITGARISGGEMTRTFGELKEQLKVHCFDVYQPDVVLSAGMSRARTFGEMVLSEGAWFTPHTWTNGIGLMANLAVTAGVGGGPYIEYPYEPGYYDSRSRDFMLTNPIRPNNGEIEVPSAPGIGVDVDLDGIKDSKFGRLISYTTNKEG